MTDQLTTADVASILGVTPATVRSYAARGAMPKPDGYLGRTPWWHRRTITKWAATRPGQGKGGGRPPKAGDGSQPAENAVPDASGSQRPSTESATTEESE